MTENLVIVVVAFCGIVGIFLALSAILGVAEKASPRFSAWLDDLEKPRDRGF